MKCIYDKSIPCEINPDGPKTKDFVCLKCHKPKGKMDYKNSTGRGENNRPLLKRRRRRRRGNRGRRMWQK